MKVQDENGFPGDGGQVNTGGCLSDSQGLVYFTCFAQASLHLLMDTFHQGFKFHFVEKFFPGTLLSVFLC